MKERKQSRKKTSTGNRAKCKARDIWKCDVKVAFVRGISGHSFIEITYIIFLRKGPGLVCSAQAG